MDEIAIYSDVGGRDGDGESAIGFPPLPSPPNARQEAQLELFPAASVCFFGRDFLWGGGWGGGAPEWRHYA